MTKRSRSTPAFGARPTPSADFQPDYSHIRGDLRRIGLIAGAFVVLLVLASFFVK